MTTLHLKKSISRSPSRLFFSLAALALACFALPTVARGACGESGDIPFTVTLLHPLPSNFVGCLYVQGPWVRTSSGANLRDLAVGHPCTFYAAENTIFSPFGPWLVLIDRECTFPLSSNRIDTKQFSLRQSNINRVDFTVDPLPGNRYDIRVSTGGNRTVEALDETAEQSQAPSPKEVSVDAWLGDSKDSPSGIAESDVFSFFGTAGDTVTIRLEADTRRGNNGGDATLRFGGPPARQVTGALTVEHPKTFTVELDSTRKYDIAVEQPLGGDEKDYRGGYILKVESAQGAIKALVPARAVEK